VLFAAAPELMKVLTKKRAVHWRAGSQVLIRVRSVPRKVKDRLERK
jgi:hypothetical protein